jgi:plasmid stabilization system protein ParE
MPVFEVLMLPVAFLDLDEIFDYILAENPQVAGSVLQNITQSLNRLHNHPHSGAPIHERSLNKFYFRMVIVSPYIAFYRVIGNEVFIYRILHGARNYPHLLKETLQDGG